LPVAKFEETYIARLEQMILSEELRIGERLPSNAHLPFTC
jgi:DNA-binding FadR family transcriptional regulator